MYKDIDDVIQQINNIKKFKASLLKEETTQVSDEEKSQEFEKFKKAVSNATEFQNLVINKGESVEMNGIVEQKIKFVYTVARNTDSKGVYLSFNEEIIKLDDNYIDIINKIYTYFNEFFDYWVNNI